MRLIDVDKLKKEIHCAYSDDLEILDKIDAQPTVYDKDKVVEQLKGLKEVEQSREDSCDEEGFGDGEEIYKDGMSAGRFAAYNQAIEIVKAGGINADNNQ